MSTLQHPRLGAITGIDHEIVIEYLGIQYASLETKFADAVLVDRRASEGIQATTLGPASVAPSSACHMEQSFLQSTLPFQNPGFSDIECLNLNVVRPKGDSRDVPVFVYVHGGGFAIGANSWPHYDLKRLVALSVKQGQPVIGVGINYRLGASGFLTSAEISKAGFRANRGLRDQQVAFKWIKQNIGGFGGSPDRITVVAGSAGSVGLFYHMQSPEPLFSQFVSMAGTPLLMKPLPPQLAEKIYQEVICALEIDGVTGEDRIQQLLAVPHTVMLEKVPPTTILNPVVDGDIVKSFASFQSWNQQEGLAKDNHKWCSRILIGDCAFDANILSYMIPPPALATIRETFLHAVSRVLEHQPAVQRELLSGYGLDQAPSDDDLERVLNFAQDIGFTVPTRKIAESFQGTAFCYSFNELNNWEGRWRGRSTHVHDAVFLFQNANESLSEKQQLSANHIATHFISFFNGKEPFPAYHAANGGVMVYGLNEEGSADFVQDDVYESCGRRNIVPKLAEKVGLDLISSVWDTVMASV